MDLKKISSALLPVAALALTFIANAVNHKNQEMQMEKTIDKKLAEKLEN